MGAAYSLQSSDPTQPEYVTALRQFVSDIVQEISKMAKRNVGGTIVINIEYPPSDDLVLSLISKYSRLHDEPYHSGILLRLFDKNKEGHDGAVIVTVFNNATWRCAPRVHSSRNTLPTTPEPLNGRGLRHLSAECISKLSSALVIVVSEERGTISISRRGQTLRDVNVEDVSSSYPQPNT
ncbi:hypothetical protein AAVH_19561 [Aphelenchoides avenae]|nr:hypothetical protein AAVH_19561 [Aphelenchus avenae]